MFYRIKERIYQISGQFVNEFPGNPKNENEFEYCCFYSFYDALQKIQHYKNTDTQWNTLSDYWLQSYTSYEKELIESA